MPVCDVTEPSECTHTRKAGIVITIQKTRQGQKQGQMKFNTQQAQKRKVESSI